MDKVVKRIYWAISESNPMYTDRMYLGSEMSLENDLEMDSLNRIELLLWLEEDFDIEFPDYEHDKWLIIEDVINSVIEAGGR